MPIKLCQMLEEQTERAASLCDLLTVRYSAMQFCNLDELTDELVEQIAVDLEILKLLEEEEENE